MLNHNNKKKVLIKSLIKQEKENHFQIQNLLPKKKKIRYPVWRKRHPLSEKLGGRKMGPHGVYWPCVLVSSAAMSAADTRGFLMPWPPFTNSRATFSGRPNFCCRQGKPISIEFYIFVSIFFSIKYPKYKRI